MREPGEVEDQLPPGVPTCPRDGGGGTPHQQPGGDQQREGAGPPGVVNVTSRLPYFHHCPVTHGWVETSARMLNDISRVARWLTIALGVIAAGFLAASLSMERPEPAAPIGFSFVAGAAGTFCVSLAAGWLGGSDDELHRGALPPDSPCVGGSMPKAI